MHPKATIAMKNQINNWLENIVLPSESDIGSGLTHPPKELEAAVRKQKKEWLDSGSARALLLDSIKDIYPALFDLKGGKLSEYVNIADATEQVFAAIEGVPYNYRVFVEFNFFYADHLFFMELGDGTLFNTFKVSDVKPESGWTENEEKKSLFFSSLTRGYLSPDRRRTLAAAATKAQGNVKNFVERALSMGVFRLKDQFEISIGIRELRQSMYVHQLDDAHTIKKKFSIGLPQDLHELIKKITVGYVRNRSARDYENALQSYLQIALTDTTAANAICSASEWRLDSLADPSPAMRLVKICIGLESLFGDDDCTTGLTRSLADRCAFVLATNHEERAKIISDCKELYTLRSKIVHGVIKRLDDADETLLQLGDSILKRAINKESSLLPKTHEVPVKFTL